MKFEGEGAFFILTLINGGGDNALNVSFSLDNENLTGPISTGKTFVLEKNGTRKILLYCYLVKVDDKTIESIENKIIVKFNDVKMKKGYEQTGEFNITWVFDEICHPSLIQLEKPSEIRY